MKLYFCLLHLKCILHVSCTFLCAVLITGLMGRLFQGDASSALLKGKHKTLLFSVIDHFFSRGFLVGFVKHFFLFPLFGQKQSM